MKRMLYTRKFVAVGGALAAATAVAMSSGGAVASAKVSAHPAAGNSVLTVESSQQNAITANYNPYVTSSASSLLGANSLIYEPLYQVDVLKPGTYYPFLATHFAWGQGGKSITFTIRKGVKWSNGTPLTAADVAFTYNLLKKNADVNTVGLDLKSVSTSGDQVTLNFPTAQYANFQNIAAQVYIVPQSVWSSVGDPGKYTDPTPVGTGPYTVDSTSSTEGIVLKANPNYWGGAPAVSTVEFPTYASANTALSALEQNSLTWAGNYIPGIQKLFANTSPQHKTWFPPVNTVSLEPNLQKWPTNQLPVRQAISLAINRTAISTQGEGGQEAPAKNASGLTQPIFDQFLSGSVSKDTLSAQADPKAAEKVLEQAGYKKDSNGYFALNGKQVTLDVTDPTNYQDYALDCQIVAANLKKAGIDATFVGQSDTGWASDIADGNFQLTEHWSQTSVSPYQLYSDWLNGALATKTNRAGNYEGLKSAAVDADLTKLAGAATPAQEAKDVAPIEQYVAKNLPIIPTVYGAVFDEYNTSQFTGWPSASDEYESGSPNAPTNEVVILHLKPKS
jgi:peptide/nickel transport system substrate-binding protein